MSNIDRGLNESHQRRLLVTFQYIDKLLAETEAVLAAAASKSAFPKYAVDFVPAQERVIHDHIARIRGQMKRAVAGLGLKVPGPQFGGIHCMRVQLSFMRVALQEVSPKNLAGYGEFPAELIPELNGFSTELQTMIESLDRFLAQAPGADQKDRLERLTLTGDHVTLLKKLDRIVFDYGLVEFRPALSNIIDRLTSPRFEIAVFGQVSSGKSSLLNAITGIDALPIGVNPVTSVPTRLIYGPQHMTVWFAGGQAKDYVVEEISEFVTEERNPANIKGVTRIVVSIPSGRLREGIVFVDTPGLGSLATAGAAETKAYLPQCDLGLVLINAGATLTAEDVQLIETLYVDGIPALILLSKCDLAAPADRERAVSYIGEQVKKQLGVSVPIYPVSVLEQYRDLTEKWFKEQIEPLYTKYQELATESIKRKIALLRDSVDAALSSKLGDDVGRAASTGDLESAERGLRAAAGQMYESERKCYTLTDELREYGANVALDRAARKLAEAWTNHAELRCGEVIRGSLNEIAAEQAGAVRQEIEALARKLAAALDAARAVLAVQTAEGTDEFGAAIREIPHIEVSRIDLNLERPMIALFGKGAARRYAKAKLRSISSDVEAAFTSYARLLQAWTRAAVKRITDIFELQSGALRAQIDRLMARTDITPEAREKMRDDLASIRSEPAITTNLPNEPVAVR